MTIKITTAITPPTATNAVKVTQFYFELQRIKYQCERWVQDANTGSPVILDRIIEPIKQLKYHRDRWATYLTLTNRTYIQSDLGQDVLEDFVSLRNAIDALIAWGAATIPKDADGNILERKLTNGIETRATLTPAQMAVAVTNLNIIIGLIV